MGPWKEMRGPPLRIVLHDIDGNTSSVHIVRVEGPSFPPRSQRVQVGLIQRILL